MTIVVSDTSPLNYLVLIDQADILPALYGRVLIPQAVFTELKKPETPEKVRAWLATTPAWIEVSQITGAPDASLSGLDEGEREAITLALEIGADALLIDEDKGRKKARALGVQVLGALRILYDASTLDLCDLEDAFNRLRQTNFRADEKLYQRFLELRKKGG
jgi:predicted nucleic acid-binding protein